MDFCDEELHKNTKIMLTNLNQEHITKDNTQPSSAVYPINARVL